MINKTIKTFLTDLESTNANVTSGSACALIGSTAISLAQKSILLTQSAKEFNSYTNDRRSALEEASMKLNTFKNNFDQLTSGYIKANESYQKDPNESNLGVLVNASYSMALTCIETIIAFDHLKDQLNKKYVNNLLIAIMNIKTVYEFCLIDIKSRATGNLSDDLADFLIQKSKILSDAESVILYCERQI